MKLTRLWVFVFLLLPFLHFFSASTSPKRQVYVVYLGEHRGGRTFSEIEETHQSYLVSVKNPNDEEAEDSLIHSYKNVINGFSALLTPEEAARLSEKDEVISVFESKPRKYKIQTTRSWEFVDLLSSLTPHQEIMGSDEELLRKANHAKDIIVGVIDTGVWPESESFSDEGMEPIPTSWKGSCQPGQEFDSSNCNRKIIGPRYFLQGYEAFYGKQQDRTLVYRSARDSDGHGTHTASTVGGRRVPNISMAGGFGNGTATGGAPHARLAIYKVCWPIPADHHDDESIVKEVTCFVDDILAAFESAIVDGVDVISLSIVGALTSYLEDGIAIGALHAVKNDVVVVCSAANEGPALSTVKNVAPWILTVAASSIDRTFRSPVLLGNGLEVEGQTVTPFDLKGKMHPLVYAGDVELPGTTNSNTTGQCLLDTLSPELVKGKIILCLSGFTYNVVKGRAAKRAGAIGFILQNSVDGIGISVESHVLPGTVVLYEDANTILKYIRSKRNPKATIVPPKTLLATKPAAPFMASFSSAGPNGLDPNILKPDITAPGLNILAAWSERGSPSHLADDSRSIKYNIDSGTSMSCPHVAAAAALVKAVHPNWSSAAIRSALMTTATQTNNIGQPMKDEDGITPATPFRYGAGHLNREKAIDPGLVYDADINDYLLFLCNSAGVKNISNFICPKDLPSPSNLNYPSVSVSKLKHSVTIQRTVTNVGKAASLYRISVTPPVGFSVQVSPGTLNFRNVREKLRFNVTIRKKGGDHRPGEHRFGWYEWNDGTHSVRSPIVVSSV